MTAAAAAAPDTTLLINNAGVLTATSLLTGDLSDISAEFDTNFYGALAMARAFAGPIESNGGSSILNVLSILSWRTLPIAGAYSSAKTASWSMTNALRLELAPKNIRVSALHVAYMDTGILNGFDLPKLDPADIASLALDGIAQTNTRSSPTTTAGRHGPASPTASQPSDETWSASAEVKTIRPRGRRQPARRPP